MDSLAQMNEEQKLSAISEPDFDLDAVEIARGRPSDFRVRHGSSPGVRSAEVEGLEDREAGSRSSDCRRGRSVAKRAWPIAAGWCPSTGLPSPAITSPTNLTFKDGDKILASADGRSDSHPPGAQFPRRQDREVRQVDGGVRAGETARAKPTLSEDAPNRALRGKKVTAIFEVLEVKKLEMPEITPELLEELGGFELEARSARRDQRSTWHASWNTSNIAEPANKSPPP